MILMKLARLAKSPNHRDSWLDIVGYAACGADITDGKEFSVSWMDRFAQVVKSTREG